MSQTIEVAVYEADPTHMQVYPVSPHLGVREAYLGVRSHVYQGQKAIQGRIILASREFFFAIPSHLNLKELTGIETKSIGEVAEGGAMPVHAVVPRTAQLDELEGEYMSLVQAVLQGNLNDYMKKKNSETRKLTDELWGNVWRIQTEIQKERDGQRKEINELQKQVEEMKRRFQEAQ